MRRTLERLPLPRQYAVDSDALPMKGAFTRASAGVIGAAAYAAGGIALALSVWAFSVFPALQVPETRISATILPDWYCAMLTKFRMETSSLATGNQFGVELGASMRSAWAQRDASLCGAGFLTLSYDALFPTHADCLSAYNLTCGGFASGQAISGPPPHLPLCYSWRVGSFANCSLAPGIKLATVGVGGATTPTEADVLAVLREAMPADAVCRPLLDNPPYLCSRNVSLGALQIAAQSLSVAQATVQALLFFAVVVAALVPTTCAARRDPVISAARRDPVFSAAELPTLPGVVFPTKVTPEGLQQQLP
jgi:hypothetical protein